MTAARGAGLTGGHALALADEHLTDRDRWLIRMLHEHAVLTNNQLVHLRFARQRSVQTRLRELYLRGVVDRFRPHRTVGGSAPWHYVLGPLGARVLAAEVGVDVAALGWRRDRSLSVSHRLSLGHDIAVTDLVCGLAADPGLRVTAWWSPGRCRRVVGVHRVRPDAYVCLTVTDRPPGPRRPPRDGGRPPAHAARRRWEMWVEYDTGTTTLATLAGKLHAYHRLAAATGVVVPVAVFVARASREPGARRALDAARRALPNPALVPVITAAPDPTTDQEIPREVAAGRVWLPLGDGPPVRRRLAELAAPRQGPTLAEISAGPADSAAPAAGRGAPERIELPAPSLYPPEPERLPLRRVSDGP